MSGQHGTSLKDYTQALTVQLRLRDVPGRHRPDRGRGRVACARDRRGSGRGVRPAGELLGPVRRPAQAGRAWGMAEPG